MTLKGKKYEKNRGRKKWSGRGQTGRNADYGPAFAVKNTVIMIIFLILKLF